MHELRRSLIMLAAALAAVTPAAAGPLSMGDREAFFAIATYGLERVAEANAGFAASGPETRMMLLGGIGLVLTTLRRRNRAFDRRQLV
ncbi:MAG: hypothetical protein KAY22_20880 [Rhizorhabdus sp.]|uniref:hypothetical protein n=1 Tax=Rhizorhabdus sp. TaxID=1968843 RepID=UPI001B40BC07|nr:hypothetical protein [Rhizorhabdus sp.]MBP8234752.1 hypothetical protein [Rhizorhabdus sp.]